MERLNDGTIVATPNDDLCALVAALQAGETLAISPGYYKLDRPIVVDKDVTIKSATNNARDVTIVRAGATALVVTGGSPKIGRLTFISPSAGEGVALANNEINYESCVAIRGGSPTLVGCRATSADQSGYSVRGEGVTARLLRCEARLTRHRGVFFDGGASGVVEDCVFADTGLGCVDVEGTPVGKCVDVVRTKLYRSEFASLSIRDGGRVRATECDIRSNLPLVALVNVSHALFLARSCHFYSEAAVPEGMTLDAVFEPKTAHALAIGIRAKDSKLEVVDSVFERLVTAYATVDFPSKLSMKRCKVVDGVESVFIDVVSPAPVFENCEFFKAPIEFDSSRSLVFVSKSEPESENDDDHPCEEVMDRHYQATIKLLGPCATTIETGDIPFLGMLYPRSRYGGTFVASNQMCFLPKAVSSNSALREFELAMATRMVNLKECDDKDDNEKTSFFAKLFRLFRSKSSDKYFRSKIIEAIMILYYIQCYISEGNIIDRYETFEIPENFGISYLAGRYFIFDTLVPESSVKPLDPVKLFDYDLNAAPDKAVFSSQEDFGLLLAIEITRDELMVARKEGGFKLVSSLKEANRWPFSDLDRE